jgi:hypothetical protein
MEIRDKLITTNKQLQQVNANGTTPQPAGNVVKSSSVQSSSVQSSSVQSSSVQTCPQEKEHPGASSKDQIRKTVLLIGNSNTSRLNFNLVGVNIIRQPAMTIKEAEQVIGDYQGRADIIILHLLTNDIGRGRELDAVKCRDDLIRLTNMAKKKAEQVIVSLGIPRSDDYSKHEMIKFVSEQLNQVLRNRYGIVTCRHDNLYHYGKPIPSYLWGDGYHLSNLGKSVFSQNLASMIKKVLGGFTFQGHNRRGM